MSDSVYTKKRVTRTVRPSRKETVDIKKKGVQRVAQWLIKQLRKV